jgi:L-aminopeptidase/D-esterase-like protein
MPENQKTLFNRRALIAVVFLILLALGSPVIGQELPNATILKKQDHPGLEFDFPAMKVGAAEYEEGPTGTTVFYFPDSVKAAVDVRGGSPGTVNATYLMKAYEYKHIQAVVFSGGSWYGLSAATGTANGIKELKAAEGDVDFIAGVVAAIIYDVGGRRYSRITPDDRLGNLAVQSAESGWFPSGARGAGRFAMQGSYFARGDSVDRFSAWAHSGQGGAFRQLGPTKIAVFTVVNSLGTIVDREGQIVRCSRNGTERKCSSIIDQLESFEPIVGSEDLKIGGPTNNTTLTLVVTNQKLPFWSLQRIAVQVHGSMNRAIQPFSTEHDGDVLYAVTTDEVENPDLLPIDLGVAASELAWDAVLNSVPDLPEPPTMLENQPSVEVIQKNVGTYRFYGGSELRISVEDGFLVAKITGNGRIFFDEDRVYRLMAAGDGLFIFDAPARDVVRFNRLGGEITGLTINPGRWPIKAKLVK